jgi:hypothetical protein
MRTSVSCLVAILLAAPFLPAADDDLDRRDPATRDPATRDPVTTPPPRTAESDWSRTAGDEDREDNYIDEGLWELNFDARLSVDRIEDSNVDVTTVAGDAGIHYFVTDWLQLGILVLGEHQEIENGPLETESSSVRGAPAITINIPTDSPVVPFIRAAAGVEYIRTDVNDQNPDDAVGFYWQAGAGLRFFVTHWASINIQAIFENSIFDDDDIDRVYSYGALAGISLYWGGTDRRNTSKD